MRETVFITAMLGVEALVVVHWFLLPYSLPLQVLAMGAAALMAIIAAADLALLAGVLRRDPRDPQQHRELKDLAHAERMWLFVTAMQLAFIAAAVLAQVYWIAAIVAVGQGAEIAAVCAARVRTRGGGPLAGTAG